MTIADFLARTNLEHSLIIGYYGGGNYGDELLLEVLMNACHARGVKHLAFMYQRPERFRSYHQDFGYHMVSSPKHLLKAFWKAKSIVIGGGGLWGLDVNRNIFFLSLALFLLRYLLRKKIYLIGIGYYGSTTRLGHLSAWLAGHAATTIIVRDDESRLNFRKLHLATQQDRDIAFIIPTLSLDTYAAEVAAIERSIELKPRLVYIALKGARTSYSRTYMQAIEAVIKNHPSTNFLLSLLWRAEDFPAGQQFMQDLSSRYPNVQILDAVHNPLALLGFFQRHRARFVFITPQLHAIITAIICRIPYLPVAYDNKVAQLLLQQGIADPVPMPALRAEDIEAFIRPYAPEARP